MQYLLNTKKESPTGGVHTAKEQYTLDSRKASSPTSVLEPGSGGVLAREQKGSSIRGLLANQDGNIDDFCGIHHLSTRNQTETPNSFHAGQQPALRFYQGLRRETIPLIILR